MMLALKRQAVSVVEKGKCQLSDGYGRTSVISGVEGNGRDALGSIPSGSRDVKV